LITNRVEENPTGNPVHLVGGLLPQFPTLSGQVGGPPRWAVAGHPDRTGGKPRSPNTTRQCAADPGQPPARLPNPISSTRCGFSATGSGRRLASCHSRICASSMGTARRSCCSSRGRKVGPERDRCGLDVRRVVHMGPFLDFAGVRRPPQACPRPLSLGTRVGHDPLCRRAGPREPRRRPLATPRMRRRDHASISPSSMRKTPHLHLIVDAADELQHPPSPVHRGPGSAGAVTSLVPFAPKGIGDRNAARSDRAVLA